MMTVIASVLLGVTLTLGVVSWIDWINRKKIQWSMRAAQRIMNGKNSDWEFVKYILRRHR
jgi:hypothetical protein